FDATGEPFTIPDLAYQANTWYRLRITQRPGENLEVSIWNDAGTSLLASHAFGFQLGALGSNFSVGFSQWMGGPNGTNSMLSAADFIRADSLLAIPEPSSLLVALIVALVPTAQLLRRRAVPVTAAG